MKKGAVSVSCQVEADDEELNSEQGTQLEAIFNSPIS